MTHKRNTTGLKPFQKGQSGNPLGGKLHNPEVKALKMLTQKELTRIGNLVIAGDVEELIRFRKELQAQMQAGTHEKTGKTAIEAMVYSLALKAVKGDQGAFETLMCRIIGKVPDKVQHSGPGGGPQTHLVMPASKSLAEKQLRAIMKKIEDDV